MGCCGDESDSDPDVPVKHDPHFKGPIDKRSCTDVICCLLFVVLFAAMVAVGGWAFYFGDPNKLIHPTDSQGRLCGYGDLEDKPNLFFFDMMECAKFGAAVVYLGCPTPQVCVPACPNSTFFSPFSGIPPGDEKEVRSKMICKYDVDATDQSKSIVDLVKDEDCAAYQVKSTAIVGRCVPSFLSLGLDGDGNVLDDHNQTVTDRHGNDINSTDLLEGTKDMAIWLNAQDYGSKILADVRSSWIMIIIGLGLAMVLGFIWILLMRWLACPIVWITLFLFVGLFAFATYYSFDKYFAMKDNPNAQGDFKFTTDFDFYANLANTWLAFGIIASVFLGISLLLLLFLRKRIQIAVALIKETSKAIANMLCTLFWPMIPFILQVILFAFYGATAIFLASIGEAQYAEYNRTEVDMGIVRDVTDLIECTPNDTSTVGNVCQFVKNGGNEYTLYLQGFMLFMLFWVANFIVALGQMTLAGAFASYYWAFDKSEDIPSYPLTGAIWRAIRYHLGTLAFGSLLVAIVQIIRVILEYVDHKLNNKENAIAKFLLKCLKCCFWCLEKFIKFINKNAFILTAVYGYSFCRSAVRAFNLILRNVVRVAVVDKVTDFLLFIAKLMIVAAIVTLAFFYFSGDLTKNVPGLGELLDPTMPALNFYLVPVIIIGFGAFVITSLFFSVFSMGVDTLFLCFLEDLERNDGTPEKPYFMSKGLMKILGKKNKVAPKDEMEMSPKGKKK